MPSYNDKSQTLPNPAKPCGCWFSNRKSSVNAHAFRALASGGKTFKFLESSSGRTLSQVNIKDSLAAIWCCFGE